MKKFMLLHVGFEKPTEEIMNAWKNWFKLIEDQNVEQGGLKGGRSIPDGGTQELSMGNEALTGFDIIKAKSLDEAEKIARDCPYVTSIRVYGVQTHG